MMLFTPTKKMQGLGRSVWSQKSRISMARRFFLFLQLVVATSLALDGERMAKRKLLQDASWTTSRNTSVLIVPTIPWDTWEEMERGWIKRPRKLPTEQQIAEAFGKVNPFFLENSAGRQGYVYEITPMFNSSLYGQQKGSRCCVPGYCKQPPDYKIMEEMKSIARANGYSIDDYDRFVVMIPRCANADYEGMAYVNDKEIWLNGFKSQKDFAITLAHELGHANGVEHSEFLNIEYGNVFSIMGESTLPQGHFSVGSKYSFNWIAPSQIVTLGRKSNRFCAADKTCRKKGGVFRLSAHDTGAYAKKRKYGIRIYLEEPNEVLWVSFRGKYFKNTRPGALLTWAYESHGNPGEFVGEYGPTSVIGYRQDATRLSYKDDLAKQNRDAPIPVGETFVYDGARTAVAIKVVRHVKIGRRRQLLVKVSFLNKAKMKPRVDASFECGSEKGKDIIPTDKKYKIYKIGNDHPSHLHFDACASSACAHHQGNSSDHNTPLPGFYVYESYPYHLDLSKTPDPRVGAMHFESLRICGDISTCTIKIENSLGSLNGIWEPDWHSSDDLKAYWHIDGDGNRYHAAWSETYSSWDFYDEEDFLLLALEPSYGPKASLGSLAHTTGFFVSYGDALGTTMSCVSSGNRIEILTKYTSTYPTISYSSFSPSSYVVLYTGDTCRANINVSYALNCAREECAENFYVGPVGNCHRCPPERPLSMSNSSLEDCYSNCKRIRLSGRLKNANGFYKQVGYFDQRPLFFSVKKKLYFHSIWGNSHWMITRGKPGDLHGALYWIKGNSKDLHPTMIKKKKIRVKCV